MTTKILERYFIRTTYRLVIIGTVSQILTLKDKKNVFLNILPIIEKIQKWTPKNQKLANPSTTHTFYDDLDSKRYQGPRDPIIGSMGYVGRGSKLKVQGTDSYPVNERIFIYTTWIKYLELHFVNFISIDMRDMKKTFLL